MTAIICVAMACATVAYAVTLGYRCVRARIGGGADVVANDVEKGLSAMSAQISKLQTEVSSHSLALGVKNMRP